MTTLTETAYPYLKPEISPHELNTAFTPTKDEVAFVESLRGRSLQRVATLMYLKLFQRLGFFPQLNAVPSVICEHIAEQIGLSIAPQQKDLKRFETSGGQTKTLNAVREFMNVRKLDADGWEWLKQRATEAADTKHSVVDILNVMLEELAHHRYELPAFSTLDRMAFGAREASNSKHFASITNQLDEKTKDLIDSLLKVEPGESVSGWQMLKREPKRPTNKETRSYLQHVKRLQHLVEFVRLHLHAQAKNPLAEGSQWQVAAPVSPLLGGRTGFL